MYVKGIDMLINNFLYFYFDILNFWKCLFWFYGMEYVIKFFCKYF